MLSTPEQEEMEYERGQPLKSRKGSSVTGSGGPLGPLFSKLCGNSINVHTLKHKLIIFGAKSKGRRTIKLRILGKCQNASS